MSEQSFETFRRLVLLDPELQKQLRPIQDLSQFAEKIVQLSCERGCEVSAQDVETAWRAARRAWIERWM